MLRCRGETGLQSTDQNCGLSVEYLASFNISAFFGANNGLDYNRWRPDLHPAGGGYELNDVLWTPIVSSFVPEWRQQIDGTADIGNKAPAHRTTVISGSRKVPSPTDRYIHLRDEYTRPAEHRQFVILRSTGNETNLRRNS